MKKQKVQVSFSIDEDLKEKIDKMAEKNCRDFTNQVRYILRKAAK